MSGRSTYGWRFRSRPADARGVPTAPEFPSGALVLLIGPAASGKSTWAASHFRPSQMLSSDAFRELVADDASDQAASRDAFRLLHLVARARLERGLLTVIDATNLQRSARKPLLALAARLDRPCVAVLFDVPLDVLLARNVGRSRTVPEEVLRRHHALMAEAVGDIQIEGYQLILFA
jgi:protein phosphatase